MQNKIDENIVRRFVCSDMRAFDNIYFVFSPKLQKFVYSLVKTKVDTEEIVQEVFVKIWANRTKLKNFTSFENYLFTIAYNTTISLLRKRIREATYVRHIKSLPVNIEDLDNTDLPNAEDMEERLAALIEKLPSRQKEVFKMKHFEGHSYKEIAEILEISVNTVDNHVVKAHKFLKENLGKNYLHTLLFICLFS